MVFSSLLPSQVSSPACTLTSFCLARLCACRTISARDGYLPCTQPFCSLVGSRKTPLGRTDTSDPLPVGFFFRVSFSGIEAENLLTLETSGLYNVYHQHAIILFPISHMDPPLQSSAITPQHIHPTSALTRHHPCTRRSQYKHNSHQQTLAASAI